MSEDEFLATPLTCPHCKRTEPIERWDICGAGDDDEPDSVLFCRHCAWQVPRPRLETAMNLVTCTTAGCDGAEHFGDTVPADWMYVLPLPVPKGRTIRPHVGTCPACLTAAKRTKVTGGTKFLPAEYDGGGKVDWQRNLFD